jgi:hypothetical protein
MYVHVYIVTCSHYHCYHVNATVPSHFIVGVGEAVNNINIFSFAMEMQHCVPFALLLSYKVCCSAVKSNKH